MIEIEFPDGKIAEFNDNTPDHVLHKFAQTYITQNNLGNKKSSPTSTKEAVARNYIDTATFGAGNKLEAATTAGLLKLTGKSPNKSYYDLYKEIKQEEQQRLAQAQEEHPVASVLTQIGTGLPMAIPAIEAAGAKLGLEGAKSALGKLAQFMGRTGTAGAGYGTLRGLGTSDSLEEIPAKVGEEAVKGGLYGVATAGILGPTVTAVKGGANLLKKVVGKESTVESAERILGNQFTPEEASQNLARLQRNQSQGRDLTLPDVGEDRIRGLTRVVGKMAGGKNLINNFFNQRSNTSNVKVTDAINKAISDKSYLQNLDDIDRARKELGGPFFQKGYEEGANIQNNANFDKLLEDNLIKKAINTGIKEYNIKSPINSAETLHSARPVIDDQIGGAIKRGENNRARVLKEARNKLNKVLYEVAPSIKEGSKIYADRSALMNAQELGRDFTKYRSTETLKKEWSNLTDGEKDAFKIGVADNLLNIVNKTGFTNSSAHKIFGNPLIRNKLKVIFGSSEEYRKFAKSMIDEMKKAQTKQRVLGGSYTDINKADEEIFNKAVQQGAKGLKIAQGDTSTIIQSIANFIDRKYYGINDKNAKEVARILIDPKRSIEVLKKSLKNADESEKSVIRKFLEDYTSLASSQVATLNKEQK